MDSETEDLVWRLRDRAKDSIIVNPQSTLANDLLEAARTIERLHKAAYLTIPLPRWLTRTRGRR